MADRDEAIGQATRDVAAAALGSAARDLPGIARALASVGLPDDGLAELEVAARILDLADRIQGSRG